MTNKKSPEKGDHLEAGVNTGPQALIVQQPQKLEGLMETLTLLDRVNEEMGEDRSGDMGGASGAQAGDDGQTSVRAQAIANLPDSPVMQKQLEKHIAKEVKSLTKQVNRLAKKSSKPGNAYQLNELYAKIRRLNTLLNELLHASVDMIKRLYVRIFIDHQKLEVGN